MRTTLALGTPQGRSLLIACTSALNPKRSHRDSDPGPEAALVHLGDEVATVQTTEFTVISTLDAAPENVTDPAHHPTTPTPTGPPLYLDKDNGLMVGVVDTVRVPEPHGPAPDVANGPEGRTQVPLGRSYRGRGVDAPPVGPRVPPSPGIHSQMPRMPKSSRRERVNHPFGSTDVHLRRGALGPKVLKKKGCKPQVKQAVQHPPLLPPQDLSSQRSAPKVLEVAKDLAESHPH